MLEELDAEDAFWNWARKKRLALGDDRYEAYAVEYEDLTQGLLWIETQWHRSPTAIEQPLVYVEALASAPWNWRSINPDPWLQGVGTVLLQFARNRSLDLGYHGRLGLPALPSSEPFYEACNVLNFGYDSAGRCLFWIWAVKPIAPLGGWGCRLTEKTSPTIQLGCKKPYKLKYKQIVTFRLGKSIRLYPVI